MAGSRIPAALRARIGDDATFGLIELLDTERNNWSEQVLSVASDRFERRLTDEISTLRDEMRNTLNEGLTSVRQELATTRVETLWLSIRVRGGFYPRPRPGALPWPARGGSGSRCWQSVRRPLL